MAYGFRNKKDALENRGPEDDVLYTKNFNTYFWTKSYQGLIDMIKNDNDRHCSEYIFEKKPVNFFYDIDIKEKKYPNEFKNYKKVINDIIDKTSNSFTSKGQEFKVIVTKSHSAENNVTDSDHKKSFHIVYRGVNCNVNC